MVHFQRSDKCKFQTISGGACPRTPLELFGASGTRNTGHLRLWRNLQQASHALETLKLESSLSGVQIQSGQTANDSSC